MNPLGIERLSVFGMPPLDHIAMAADLGCDCVGIGLAPTGSFNPHGYPQWSLRDDLRLRRETIAALGDTGLAISVLEGFAVGADTPMASWEHDLDLLCELGGTRVAVVSLDKDLGRSIEGFARLAEAARGRNLEVCAELGSLGPIGRLEPALAVVRGAGMGNFSLMIDTMHYFRLGNTIDELAALDPDVIGYVQLCDAPWQPRFETYMEEAMYERLAPGDGELPLAQFVRLIPRDVVVSLEIPMRGLAERGIEPRERLGPCVTAARNLIASAR